MADLAAEPFDQIGHVVLTVGERLAEALAQRSREREDLAHGRWAIGATARPFLHPME
jgi:hypothetical protein